ncbi:FAD-binding dehydrogenase [Geomicrobium sp. JCM 19055]|uniref:FAD-binding dehydrogenase n=1 Tax=Geomicrobium sp. JCM 19055 TaxID=1460649 RepID=UPI00045ECC5A|nr:FAD-binding dehydrogenase [Geomicrobium sp. JCM 19055]GAJ97630.1 fumarate/succinate/L-aspartate dehydrogenase [Geomicrobium sp. JCM 19055]
MKFDTIVVGSGLSGLVAATEIAERKKRVLLIDQEGRQSLGGQAYWSFGGLFLIDSPEQRKLNIQDSADLGWQDWQGSASWDRLTDPYDEDIWAKKWAEAYVNFAAGRKREWLQSLGIRFFPIVGWAERGGSLAHEHGNSVPRFHIVWGTGPAILQPFITKLNDLQNLTYLPRHQVDQLIMSGGKIVGVEGYRLEESNAMRGRASSKTAIGEFRYLADSVVIASGGIGGNLDLVRKNWPTWLGKAPKKMIAGVPEYVNGRLLQVSEQVGARTVNKDRMWHYTEGIRNWYPMWKSHGIRILPGPSSIWLSATGDRFSAPNFPGFDTLSTLKAIQDTGYDYSWFITTKEIVEREFALSGSEQNPDLTGKNLKLVLKRALPGPTTAVQSFLDFGEDFVTAQSLPELVNKMNTLTDEPLLNLDTIKDTIVARDRELNNPFTKDAQVQAIHNARQYIGDQKIRVAKPHQILDQNHGPLIAVKLHILSRKTLGGLQTNLEGAVLKDGIQPLPGLYAAGEAAGFGGGGVHGYRSLEGTFLGGCLFSGLQVGHTLGSS